MTKQEMLKKIEDLKEEIFKTESFARRTSYSYEMSMLIEELKKDFGYDYFEERKKMLGL